jgi:hypothetical protein
MSQADSREVATPPGNLLERRTHSRRPSDLGDLIVTTSTGQQVARAVDESDGGIGLLMPNVNDLRRGDLLQVTYGGTTRWGSFRWYQRHSDGRYRAGIQWETEDRRNRRTAPLNPQDSAHFLFLEGWYCVCTSPKNYERDQTVVVLPEGARLFVHPNSIKTKSVLKRCRELASTPVDTTLLRSGIYPSDLFAERDRNRLIPLIIDFEFKIFPSL